MSKHAGSWRQSDALGEILFLDSPQAVADEPTYRNNVLHLIALPARSPGLFLNNPRCEPPSQIEETDQRVLSLTCECDSSAKAWASRPWPAVT